MTVFSYLVAYTLISVPFLKDLKISIKNRNVSHYESDNMGIKLKISRAYFIRNYCINIDLPQNTPFVKVF